MSSEVKQEDLLDFRDSIEVRDTSGQSTMSETQLTFGAM